MKYIYKKGKIRDITSYVDVVLGDKGWSRNKFEIILGEKGWSKKPKALSC